jgi:hypothetical protein
MWKRTLMTGVVAVAAALAVVPSARAQFGGPHEQALTTWYHQYLNREPDPAGWQTHLQQMYAGRPYEEIQSGILASEEYFNNCGRNPWVLVKNVFEHTYGRCPSPQEAQCFVAQLPTGCVAERVNVVAAIRQGGHAPQVAPFAQAPWTPPYAAQVRFKVNPHGFPPAHRPYPYRGW